MNFLTIALLVTGIAFLLFQIFFRDNSGKFKSDLKIEKKFSIPKLVITCILGLLCLFFVILFIISFFR